MQLIPHNALEVLEFDKVIELVRGYAVGVGGRQLADEIAPGKDADHIKQELDIIEDALQLIENGASLFSASYPLLQDVYKKLRVEGYVVPGEELIEVANVLIQVSSIYTFFDDEANAEYPHLATVASPLTDPSEYLAQFEQILDEEGSVRPDASPELQRLSAEMARKRKQGDQAFQKIVRKYSDQGWLSETLESVRNGRRVLAVQAERKRKIRGIIHDQSATGKTAFVEPEEIIELNNDVIELQAARRAEERKLLLALCDILRPEIATLEMYEDVLAQMDLCLAKARFARSLGGVNPEIQQDPVLHIEQGRHPLLLLKNKAGRKKTVPFNLHLKDGNKILVLSGPNAGGKSILMKSVGLLQVMVQAGLLVPVDASSTFGVFHQVCVELGDQQSIENDLSTYSSRLRDMKAFVARANEKTMLLIDEFGSGTDPKLGGAIAEAILDQVRRKGVFGVLTTHYSELKVYAFKTRGIVNGAMIFDQDSMAPSYQLRIGAPGSSFAFEIAEKTGLPPAILKYARKRAGKQTRALEDLLGDLERQKQVLRAKLAEVNDKEKQIDKLVRNYERLQLDLTAQRKKFRLEQKERDYQHVSQLNKELEKAIRSIKEDQNLEAARKTLAQVKEVKENTRKEIKSINTALAGTINRDVASLKKGDFVKVHNGLHTGKIERIEKGKATVIIGQLRMKVPVKDLTPAPDPLEINPRASIQSDLAQADVGHFNPLLDIRGLRVDDARELLEKFLDGALMSGTSPVQIIHGKGTGALKKVVKEKLKEYPVSAVRNPEDQSGGSGATIVEF